MKTSRPSVCHMTTRLIKGGADFNIYHTMLGSAGFFDQTLVVGAEYDKEMIEGLKARGISIKVIPHIRRGINPFNEIMAFFTLCRFLRKSRFDIIHTHNAKTGILGRFAAPSGPCIVHGVHGMSFTPSMAKPVFLLFRFLERLAASKTDYYVSVGKMIRDIMLEHGIGRADQYRVIHSGMYLERFRSASASTALDSLRRSFGFEREDVVVLVLARLEKRKGQHLFLEAFAKALNCPDSGDSSGTGRLKALLVGDGPEREKLKERISMDDLAGRVVMAGFRDDPHIMLAISDMVCLTSQWEGVPQSLIQAAAAGKPAIAFDVPGIREIIVPGSTGLVVPYPDTTSFAAELCRLAREEELRLSLGKGAQQLDLEEFSITVMVDRTVAFYREIIA